MMAGIRVVVAALLLVPTSASEHLLHLLQSGQGQRTKAVVHGAGEAPAKLLQELLICNAYASSVALDVYHVQSLERMTGRHPLEYKECREFEMPLADGGQLDFKAGDIDVGTFYATGLPEESASLLLIPHRRDSHSLAISFESHAFRDLESPQIAIVDAYKGSEEGDSKEGDSKVKIMDKVPVAGAGEAVEEFLKFSSVVAMNPGNYKVGLRGHNHTYGLIAENQVKYVVIRVGNDAVTGHGEHRYHEELVVFPSGSLRSRLSVLSLALCALATSLSNFF